MYLTKEKIQRLLSWVCLIFGLSMLGMAGFGAIDLMRNTAVVDATITGSKERILQNDEMFNKSKTAGYAALLAYEYNGQTYTSESALTYSVEPTVGDSVEVRIWKSEPTKVLSSMALYNSCSVGIVFVILGVILRKTKEKKHD